LVVASRCHGKLGSMYLRGSGFLASLREFWLKRCNAYFPIVLILLLAASLRFVGISRESIWLDEGVSIWASRMSIPNMISWTASDIHPPFYYLALKFWTLFGQSEFAFRSFSALFGVLTVLAVYFVCLDLFGKGVGLVASLLMAVSPVNVYYSQEIRMFSLMAFLVLVSCYSFWKCLGTPGKRVLIVYVVSSVIMLYTHYFGVLVVCFQGLYFIAVFFLNGTLIKNKKAVAGCLIATFLLYAPWLPALYGTIFHPQVGMGWMPKPDLFLLRDCYFGMMGGFAPDIRGVSDFWGLLLIPLFFTVVGMVAGLRKPLSARAFFSAFVLFPLAVFVISLAVEPILLLRQVSIFIPELVMVMAFGIIFVSSKISLRRRVSGRFFAVVAVCLLVGINLVSVYQSYVIDTKEDWRGVALDAANVSEDIPIIIPVWYVKLPFEYYYKGSAVILTAASLPEIDKVLSGKSEFLFILPLSYVDENRIIPDLKEHFHLADEKSYIKIDVYHFRR
jgi:mannosyltransferase